MMSFTIQDFSGLYRTTHDYKRLYRSIQEYRGLNKTIWDFARQFVTLAVKNTNYYSQQMMIIQSESILPILRTLIKTVIIHNKNSEDIPYMATTGECILAGNI